MNPPRRNVDLSYWKYFFIAEEDRNAMDRWMVDGKCYKRSDLNELFVPEPSLGDPEKSTRAETDKAKRICNGTDDGKVCPVREKCGDYAIEHGIWEGVWGGMSQRERRRVSRQRRLEAAGEIAAQKLQSPKAGRRGRS